MDNVIELSHLTYQYSQNSSQVKPAIEDVNLEIEKGEFLGIIGHTGSGKSTLIQHFNGLLRPTSGTIRVNGQDIWERPKEIRKVRFEVGIVFQYPEHQLFEETVAKDIAFGPRNMGLSEEDIKQRVQKAAELVGLRSDMMEASPFELSGGQKRRVSIAGVIAMEPAVLVLDEPTAGLDPKGREQILSMVKNYHLQMGNTVILVSHSMEDVANYAHKVLVMNHAKVHTYDTVEAVFSKADELESLGLDVPQITRICHDLAAKGYPIRANTFTVEQAREQLLSLFAKEEIK